MTSPYEPGWVPPSPSPRYPRVPPPDPRPPRPVGAAIVLVGVVLLLTYIAIPLFA